MSGFRPSRRQVLAGTGAIASALALGPRWSWGAEGKILKVRSYSDLQVLDPINRKSAPEDHITACTFNNLIKWKPGEKWEWDLDAAEMIEQVDDTHINFRLKQGLKWSGDYGEVTAEDVKYSYERIADPKNESPYKDDFAVLDRIEVTDKYSGTIVLKEFFAPLWTSTLPEGSGKIVSKAAVEKAGGSFTTEIPAASGPYIIKEWVPKQRTVLARNPAYGGEQPYFDEIHILPIEDEKTAEIAFEAGDVDYTGVSLSSLSRFKQSPPAHSKLQEAPSLAYVWLGMNVDHPSFQDQKVRRAIQHAVNVDAVLEAAYFGVAQRATGIIAPGLPGNRVKNIYGYDPEKAKALLKEAGKEGMKATLSVLNKTERLSAAQIVQANLAEVGVTIEIIPYDSGVFWSLGDQASGEAWKELQMIINRFSMAPDPSWATVWFTPDQVGVWNWERWNNAEFGELHKKGLVEKDVAKRDEMYKRMQDLMEESGAYVFLTHEANAAIYRDDLVPATQPDGWTSVILPEFKKVG
ncbi:MAG: ABC transporter substrate-binding protein [Rhodospirillales bacterium]|nr:ABC transporter substrate-binding protein [Rhodospirillales bacterium]